VGAHPVQRYHELLTDSRLASDSLEQLESELRSQNLFLNPTQPLCTVLRPRFVSQSNFEYLSTQTRVLTTAIHTLQTAAHADANLRKRFHLTDWEEQLLAIPAGYSSQSPISRFDGFLPDSGTVKFCELNAQSPAGAGYADALSDIFCSLPIMLKFAQEFTYKRMRLTQNILENLLDLYREWAGNSSTAPRIAILDWNDVPTRQEFRLLQKSFADSGYPTQIVTPDDLEFCDGKLTALGEPINLVYRRVILSQLVERGGMGHPLIQAAQAGAVCVVNPVACRLPGKKASFAILSDEEYSELFTPMQRDAIRESIPWTRVVEERRTMFEGELIDLIPFLIRNQQRFVLKPNDAYGGNKIVLGWTVHAKEWELALVNAIAEPFVAQERIDIPQESFPIYESGQLRFESFRLDTCPFVNRENTVFGCLTRISNADLINVATGSSMVPTFLL
jgi:uncharacterized circularly permuted ATP-grasp superfamily protein